MTPRKAAAAVASKIEVPPSITFELPDLQAIGEGIEAIESAAQGMFALDKAVLELRTNDHKVAATYEHGTWAITVEEHKS